MFFLKTSPPKKNIPQDVLGIRVRENARARRLSLRADARTGDVILIWPKRASLAAATRFVDAHRDWIARQQAHIQKPEDITPGMTISVGGESLMIVQGSPRGLTRIEDGRIIVHGRPEHLQRRLRDFLKAEALRRLQGLSDEKSARLGLPPPQLRILDPRTRWGSCGPDGKIMYSWRIIMAPPAVMDYLVAHEVAHRRHMNHGKEFWRLCLSLCENGAASRRWLKTHGQALMRYL